MTLSTEQIQQAYNLFLSIIGYVAPISLAIALGLKVARIGIRAITGRY